MLHGDRALGTVPYELRFRKRPQAMFLLDSVRIITTDEQIAPHRQQRYTLVCTVYKLTTSTTNPTYLPNRTFAPREDIQYSGDYKPYCGRFEPCHHTLGVNASSGVGSARPPPHNKAKC